MSVKHNHAFMGPQSTFYKQNIAIFVCQYRSFLSFWKNSFRTGWFQQTFLLCFLMVLLQSSAIYWLKLLIMTHLHFFFSNKSVHNRFVTSQVLPDCQEEDLKFTKNAFSRPKASQNLVLGCLRQQVCVMGGVHNQQPLRSSRRQAARRCCCWQPQPWALLLADDPSSLSLPSQLLLSPPAVPPAGAQPQCQSPTSLAITFAFSGERLPAKCRWKSTCRSNSFSRCCSSKIVSMK